MVATIQDYDANINIAERAKQQEFARNLKRAQANQKNKQSEEKEQYTQELASGIKTSKPGVSDSKKDKKQTDAQRKQSLKTKQKWHARMIKARSRKKKKKLLTKKFTKIIKQYQRISWTLLWVAAFADALFDILIIPILSIILSFCTSLYINVALWSVGDKKDRTKRRIIRASASTLDLIPIINFLPISVLIIYKTQEDEKKRVRRAKRALKKLEKI